MATVKHLSRRFAITLVTLFGTLTLSAAAKVTAKEFITERPTLISLGFEWQIDGDDNRNAAVAPGSRAHQRKRVCLHYSQHVCGKHLRSGTRDRLRVPLRAERSRWRRG